MIFFGTMFSLILLCDLVFVWHISWSLSDSGQLSDLEFSSQVGGRGDLLNSTMNYPGLCITHDFVITICMKFNAQRRRTPPCRLLDLSMQPTTTVQHPHRLRHLKTPLFRYGEALVRKRLNDKSSKPIDIYRFILNRSESLVILHGFHALSVQKTSMFTTFLLACFFFLQRLYCHSFRLS